jgi:hypothetical protein
MLYGAAPNATSPALAGKLNVASELQQLLS